MKKLFKLFVIFCLFPSYSLTMEIQERSQCIELFQQSPKYLIHIGFREGLPKDGIMRPGMHDAANYFSVNGLLPSNDYMPQLDDAKFVILLELTDTIKSRIVGFHVTEVLVAGEINLYYEKCQIIAPKNHRIPEMLKTKVNYYEYDSSLWSKGNALKNRNDKTMEVLGTLGAYPLSLEKEKDYFGKWSWSNTTIAHGLFNEKKVNVNEDGKPDFFTDILQKLSVMPYTCPGCFDLPEGINHLSLLKGAIHNQDEEQIERHKTDLIAWTQSLGHLNASTREDFLKRVNSLANARSKNENCIIS